MSCSFLFVGEGGLQPFWMILMVLYRQRPDTIFLLVHVLVCILLKLPRDGTVEVATVRKWCIY